MHYYSQIECLSSDARRTKCGASLYVFRCLYARFLDKASGYLLPVFHDAVGMHYFEVGIHFPTTATERFFVSIQSFGLESAGVSGRSLAFGRPVYSFRPLKTDTCPFNQVHTILSICFQIGIAIHYVNLAL